jgi:hypothetical protein
MVWHRAVFIVNAAAPDGWLTTQIVDIDHWWTDEAYQANVFQALAKSGIVGEDVVWSGQPLRAVEHDAYVANAVDWIKDNKGGDAPLTPEGVERTETADG